MAEEFETVYSTGPQGRIVCPKCGLMPCQCPKPKNQTEPVRVYFRRTGKGSGMTYIEKIPMHPAGKEELLSSFKKKLGVGGTVKNGVLEVQGDRREAVKKELETKGYKVKLIG